MVTISEKKKSYLKSERTDLFTRYLEYIGIIYRLTRGSIVSFQIHQGRRDAHVGRFGSPFISGRNSTTV